MPQQFEESLQPDPATPLPVDGEYSAAVITPLSAPVLTDPSTTQEEMKQRKRRRLLSRREAVVGLIGLVGGIVVGAGGTLAALQSTQVSNPVNPDLPQEATNLDLSAGTTGWFLAGDTPQDYAIGNEPTLLLNGKVYLKSQVAHPSGFGTLMQAFQGSQYRGKRVRMTANVKAQAVQNWAGLWMRVDGTNQHILGFDNMQDRPIRGTLDWKQYAIVLDVPQESIGIFFGILLVGQGEVWLENVKFEIVNNTVPKTGS
jgi:hypothetical protein